MANSLLVLLLAFSLAAFLVTAGQSLDVDVVSQEQNLDVLSNSTSCFSKSLVYGLNTGGNGAFDGIVHFEKFLADEKAKLLSPSSCLNDEEEVIQQNHFSENSHASGNCLSDIQYVTESVKRRIPWALDMIDSGGKPSSGVLRGNDLFVGDFDECMDVDTGVDFEGQYCTTGIVISEIHNTTLTTKLQFILGVCFPSSCEAKDVENYINDYFQSHKDISAIAMQTHCQERHMSLSTKAKVVICICSLFVALLVIGTFYDVVYKRWWLEQERSPNTGWNQNASDQTHSEHEPIIDPRLQKPMLYSNNKTTPIEMPSAFYDVCDEVLMSFSVYTNTGKLFAISQSPDSIACIHGMRFISLTWIILLHTYVMSNRMYENVQPFTDDALSDWAFMPIIRSVVAVDTFFAMSGILLAYVVFKKLTNEDVTLKFFGSFYLHRFLRLTPPYMLTLMTYVPLFKYISDGPFWPQDGIERDECKDTWWTNLLYLNNFIKTDKICMVWSWYLSCDFQFYLVSPLIFLPLFFYQWKGLIVPFAFLLGNAICSGVISNENDLGAVGPFTVSRHDNPLNSYFKLYYIKPYTRIGPFVIGMITGFLLFKLRCKAYMPKRAVVLGWMSATAIALAVVYGLHDHVKHEDYQSTEVRALYNALYNIGWGISVCWVIFACVTGYGGFVNTFLSWKGFIPLSRLSYCAYLVHPLVIQCYFLSQRKPYYINNFNTSYLFVAMLALSYAVAYIPYIAYEIPMVGLEKAVKGRGKKR